MKRIEYFNSIRRIDELISLACDDALAANGCVLDLMLPPNEARDWNEWLSGDVIDAADIQDEMREMRAQIDLAVSEL